jgi:nucleotide-binding universal stress UspA family protein
MPSPKRRSLFRRILVPHDLSLRADAALRAAARLLPPGGELVVLHVVVPTVSIDELPVSGLGRYISEAEFMHGARRELERVVERAFGRRRPRLTLTAAIGDPAQTILREGRRADLIVLSTQGRTGLAHFVIGSVAERVVRHSARPVLTVRP